MIADAIKGNKAAKEIIAFELPVEVQSSPFRHFVVPNLMLPGPADSVLSWLETVAEWKLQVQEGFYECYGYNFKNMEPSSEIAFLVDPEFLGQLRRYVGRAFSVELEDKVDVSAHKLVPPQKMGVHTDYGPVGQTHRLLVQLNRGWSVQQGGILMMFDEESPTDAKDSHRYYLPEHCLGIGFEISSASFHAINPIVFGDRNTLCFSFYAK